MTTKTYLVTGGAGFIGSHIAATLLERGETVRIFDSLVTGREINLAALKGQAEYIQGDLRDGVVLKEAMRGVDVVFHQAAIASVPRSIADPTGSLEINVNGTQNVLLAARDAGVRRVVFASSSAIYGDAPEFPKREDMYPAPLSPYALHKLTGEFLCSIFTRIYGLETIALRYFNVFGPRQDPASEYAAVIPRFLSLLSTGQRPVIFGDGEQTRDFVYVGDVVRANLLASTSSKAVGAVINIGAGKHTSLNTVLRIARELLGVQIEAEYRDGRPGDVRDSLADIQLAHRLLGFQPEIDLRTGLALTLESVRQVHAG